MFLLSAYSDGAGSIAAAQPIIFWFIFVTGWNTIWLLTLVWSQRQWPEIFWISNNLALVLMGAVLLTALRVGCLGEITALAIFAALSIASSVLDLWQTADSYLSDIGY